jgi:hypothetical protein
MRAMADDAATILRIYQLLRDAAGPRDEPYEMDHALLRELQESFDNTATFAESSLEESRAREAIYAAEALRQAISNLVVASHPERDTDDESEGDDSRWLTFDEALDYLRGAVGELIAWSVTPAGSERHVTVASGRLERLTNNGHEPHWLIWTQDTSSVPLPTPPFFTLRPSIISSIRLREAALPTELEIRHVDGSTISISFYGSKPTDGSETDDGGIVIRGRFGVESAHDGGAPT